MGGILDQLANYDPDRFVAARQQAQAGVADIQAQATLRQEQAKQEAIQTQLLQRQVRDADIMQRAYINVPMEPADSPEAYHQKVQSYMIRNGISAPGMLAFQQHAVDVQKKYADLSKEQNETAAANLEHVGQTLGEISQLPLEQRAQALQNALPALRRWEPDYNWGAMQVDDSSLQSHKGVASYVAKLHEQQAQTKAQEAKAGSDTALASLNTEKAKREKLLNDAIQKAQAAQQQAQTTGQHPVDLVLPASLDPQMNSSFKASYDTIRTQPPDQNGRWPAADSILTAAAQHAAQISAANNPLIRQGKANEAAAVEEAKIPGEIKKARALAPIHIAEEVDKQIAIAKNSPDAFAPIADPRSRTAAMTNYEKDSKEYADKVAAARQLQDFVTAAQSGNKAAPGMIPMSQVRMLVNRVTRQELEGVSSAAGNAADRLQGFIDKYKEGQPIPPAILKDTAAIADTMAAAARRTYQYKVQVTNKTYGSKATPIELEAPAAAAPNAAAPQPTHRFNPATGKIEPI